MSAEVPPVEITVRRNPITGWVADRRVSVKSLLAVTLIALVAIGSGYYSIGRMSGLNNDLKAMKSHHVESLEQLVLIRQGIGEGYRGMMLWGFRTYDPTFGTQGRQSAADGDARVDAALAVYKVRAADSAARLKALAELQPSLEYYRVLRNTGTFMEPVPAGFVMPPADKNVQAYWDTEVTMNGAILQLQNLENSEADTVAARATREYIRARTLLIVSLALGLILALAVGAGVSRIMATQLRAVRHALVAVAGGDLSQKAQVRARDELGQMAVAVNQAIDSVRLTVGTLATGAHTLGSNSDRLTEINTRIGANDAGSVSQSVQTVAAASEQMGASIREIAQNANDAARVAAEAVAVAENTNQTVSKLGESSTEIGNVVKVITSIAAQTNLLALNATIEAARAGDAGKGFAVVASEVKDLAQETGRATEDISRRVEAIQADTANAVVAIGEISQIIARINDYQLTIASAVEEQTATTGEMSRNVGDAAAGAANIAKNVTDVAAAAVGTGVILVESDETVGELSRLAADLQSAVGRFRL